MHLFVVFVTPLGFKPKTFRTFSDLIQLIKKRLCQNTNAFLKINNPKLLNKKNYSDTGVNHRFSRKITQIRGTIDKKWEKEAFVGVR